MDFVNQNCNVKSGKFLFTLFIYNKFQDANLVLTSFMVGYLCSPLSSPEDVKASHYIQSFTNNLSPIHAMAIGSYNVATAALAHTDRSKAAKHWHHWAVDKVGEVSWPGHVVGRSWT